MSPSHKPFTQSWYHYAEFAMACELSYPSCVHKTHSSISTIESTCSGDNSPCQIHKEDLDDLVLQCKTKEGSLHFQQFIRSSDPENTGEVLHRLLPHIQKLSEDRFGNYCIQVLAQSASVSQRLEILGEIKDKISEMACHHKATHSLQALINLCSTAEEEKIYYENLKGKVCLLSKHVYASHVIQKLLVITRNKHLYIKEILGRTFEIAVHKYGICVLKSILKNPEVLREMLGNITELMQDPYGNYAIQSLIEIWGEEISFEVNCAIKGKVAQLCMQKYASNAIESCLVVEEMRDKIIEELLENEKLKSIINNPYGIYVIKAALRLVTGNKKKKLVKNLVMTKTKNLSRVL